MRWPLPFMVLVLTALAATTATGEHATAHFTFHYPRIDAASISKTAERVESEYARITGALGVTDMPRVHVTFYTDHAALEAATRSRAGIVPSWAYGLVTSADQIHCMSPNQPNWGPHDRRMSDIVHEFAHAVTLHMNPAIANSPRWLWEAVAIYEAGQRPDPGRLSAAISRRPPALTAMDEIADTRIYDVGYTIAEFIVSRWGEARLRELVLKSGDTDRVLGVSPETFESLWIAFVRERYRG